MASSKAHIAAVDKYNARTYDRLAIRIPAGKRDQIKAYADSIGVSMASFILNAIDKAMTDDKGTANRADKD